MIFDVDDMHDGNHRLDLLWQLKRANPKFRMTAFAVPGLCTPRFLSTLPDWIEVAAHGWMHGGPDCSDPRECEDWSRDDTANLLDSLHPRFVHVWKSPGWQISDGTYEALLERDWMVADQHYNDRRRPIKLRSHCEGDGDHHHHHVQDWGSNGLAESWSTILPAVTTADTFAMISEVAA